MALTVLWIILGLILLVKGADWLVGGASSLAQRYGVSDLIIGLTIVAFGTSAPELIVNIFSSLKGYQDLVLGNVLGSNIFNLFMILGVAGLISPLLVQSSTVWKEIPISLGAVLAMLLLANLAFFSSDSGLSRLDGLVLLILFGAFLAYVYQQLKVEPPPPTHSESRTSSWLIWAAIVGGLLGLVLGGEILVRNAVNLARLLGVEEKIIGLTIVAAGTSLPELATSVVAALKKNNDIAVGNIIGSNIFNIFLILGVSALIRPVPFDGLFNQELLMLGAGTLFLFVAMFTGERQKLDRWEAAVLLLAFVAYMTLLFQRTAA